MLIAIEADAWWSQEAWRGAPSRGDLRAQLPDSLERPELPSIARRSLAVAAFGPVGHEPSVEVLGLGAGMQAGLVHVRNRGDHVDLELRARAAGGIRPSRSTRPLGSLSPGSALLFAVNGRHPAKSSGGPWRYIDEMTLIAWPESVPRQFDVQELVEGLEVRTIDLREILP